MKPTIGLIVHYVNDAGDHLPALVLWVEEASFAVFESGTPEWLSLLIFDRVGNQSLREQVVQDPTAKHARTWHFVE